MKFLLLGSPIAGLGGGSKGVKNAVRSFSRQMDSMEQRKIGWPEGAAKTAGDVVHSSATAARWEQARPRIVNLAIDSKLRGCDLLRLRVSDLRMGSEIRSRAKIIQKTTGDAVQFEVTQQTRDALEAWIAVKELRPHDWLFPSRKDAMHHLSTRQYSRIVEGWVRSSGLPRWTVTMRDRGYLFAIAA